MERGRRRPPGRHRRLIYQPATTVILCSQGDSTQQWVRVSAGNGTVKVENKSSGGPNLCLHSMWAFHPCSRGDKQQIWTFAHKV